MRLWWLHATAKKSLLHFPKVRWGQCGFPLRGLVVRLSGFKVTVDGHELDVASVTLPDLTTKAASGFRLVELKSKDDCIKHTRHCGWCTGKTDNDHYERVYQYGKLYCIYKPKKRRPSYQLYISPDNRVEFRRKGNKAVDPWKLCKDDPAINELIGALLPEKKAQSRQDLFNEQFQCRFEPGWVGFDPAAIDCLATQQSIRELISNNGWFYHREQGRDVVGFERGYDRSPYFFNDRIIASIPYFIKDELEAGHIVQYFDRSLFELNKTGRKASYDRPEGDYRMDVSLNYEMNPEMLERYLFSALKDEGFPIYRHRQTKQLRLDENYEMRVTERNDRSDYRIVYHVSIRRREPTRWVGRGSGIMF